MDKSEWGQGPWLLEQDEDEWLTEAGLPAMMLRNGAGAWCGYVAVPAGSPLHGRAYGEEIGWLQPFLEERMNHPLGKQGGLGVLVNLLFGEVHPTLEMCVNVHGGITFSGSNKDSWWFGFDCNHAGDITPQYGEIYDGAVYRDRAYVRLECERMARQLADMSAAGAVDG